MTLQVQGEGGRRYCASPPTSGRGRGGRRASAARRDRPRTQEPTPYLRVRDNLEALVHRSVFYQLVELAVPRRIDGIEWLGVWSHGEFFPIGPQPD